ncbi:MAG: M1 family aminopeptidase [Bacteroidota bacterium]
MFSTIYKYEIKHWLRQPSTYIFAILFFIVPFATMTGMAGESADGYGGRVLNSAFNVNRVATYFNIFLYFLLPAFVGVSIYRDFKSRVHSVLYSYPFSKNDYLLAKLSSGVTVVLMMSMLVMLGLFVGIKMPWVNPELIGDFGPMAFVQPFLLFMVPNVLVLGVIVFVAVTFTRNIYAGFAAIIVLVLLRAAFGRLLAGTDQLFLNALLEPLGTGGVQYFTRNWTVAEMNELLIPFKGAIIYNRLLWSGLAAILFGWMYRAFSLGQQAPVFWKKTKEENIAPKNNFGTIEKINLPKVQFDYSFWQQIKTTWQLSNIEFRFIVGSPLFLCLVLASMVFMVFSMSLMNPRFDTEVYPMTWLMLKLPAQMFSGIINLITFLYAGFLVHRSRLARAQQLVDVNPVSNWVFLFSNLLALIKMQVVLLALVMLGGVSVQLYNGFYDVEVGHYLFELYGVNLIHFVIWACLALFIQSLFTNPYLGFVLLLTAPVGFISLSHFGPEYLGWHFLEQGVFRYNQGPGEIFGLAYSDMDKYGPVLPAYFIHKIYWLMAGFVLLVGAGLLWVRGLTYSFGERLRVARGRFKGKLAILTTLLLIGFFSLGFTIYYDGNIVKKHYSQKEKKLVFLEAEKKYKYLLGMPQPKIVDVKINMDIYPAARQFKAKGKYVLINFSDKIIDTLVLNYFSDLKINYQFDKKAVPISQENIANICHLDILKLATGILPNDSLVMTFNVENFPQTFLRTNSYVKKHGTLIKDDVFPRFGNWLGTIREILYLPVSESLSFPADSTALKQSFVSKDSDRIKFEATVSTNENQVAIAPGYLEKEWTEKNRRYFKYSMEEKIAHSFLFMSGEYGIVKDKWKDVGLEIHYHKDHTYNLDRMMEGMKAGLDYCTENFSPYQHRQLRIVEFSQTGGASAHAFPNTLPTGEEAGFIQHVCEGETAGVDVVFGTAVHETAHQWWGHQVLPADVRGAKMVTESMAEYVNVMVKEKYKGKTESRKFLRHCLELYLRGRARDRRAENPLMYTTARQNYIHYAKGALVFYALADYIGEQNLNRAIKNYVDHVAFQEGSYTTSEEMLDFIKDEIPDSLNYLIRDLFETVTLYDNRMVSVNTKPLTDGKYQVELAFLSSKYRSGKNGKKIFSENQVDSLAYLNDKSEEITNSLPLSDYIEIGIFGEKEVDGKKEIVQLYLQKHKVEKIKNKISIVVDGLPTEVGVDPYLKLIDVVAEDNRMKIELRDQRNY